MTGTTADGYNDNVTTNTYDARGRLATVTQQKNTANYGDYGTLQTTLYATYTYDNRGLVTQTVNMTASGGTELNEVNTTYDSMGRVSQRSIGDGNGHSLTTTYDYDALGRVWQVTDPSGYKTVTQYDDAGRTVSQTDGAGNIVETQYDAVGRVVKTIRKDYKPGSITTLASDYLWYVTALAYDAEGRTTQVTDQGEDTDHNGVGEGKTGANDYLIAATHYTHAAFTTYVVATDPLLHHTRSGYDGLGQRRCLQEGGSGTLGSETYAAETRFDYEPTGRLAAMVSGGPDGLVDSPHDSDNQTTSYAYDSHGQLLTTTYPDSGTVGNVYYPNNGALATATDQRGFVTSYAYQAVSVGSDYQFQTTEGVTGGSPAGDQEVVTTRDGLGRVVHIITNDTTGGTQTSRVSNCYEYHGALGRQDQQIGDSSGDERRVKYDYDANGRLTGLNWPYMRGEWGGDHVDYSCFDGLGRPKTIQNCIGGSYTHLVTYTFLGHRVAVKEYPQSTPSYTVRQTFWSLDENNYDPYGRLLRSHAVLDPGGAASPLMDIYYLYDGGGNPLWRYDALQNSGTTSWSQAYQYDVQNRLTQAGQGPMNGTWPSAPAMSAPVKTWIWDDGAIHTMDALGNFNNYFNGVTDDMRTHNVANQITQRYGAAMSYDDNGNLINNSLTFKAVYDFRNRLVQVTRQDDTLQAAYSYDGLNRRIRKTTYDTDGTTVLSDVRYIYDGEWRVIEERDLTNYNQLVARYVYGTQYVDELVRTYRDFDADGEFTGTNETLCYLQDRLFNVVALTDVYGAVQERVFYEPYGRSTCHRIVDDDETVGSHFGNPYLFTGRELDSETCFYNYRARYYSPMLCRFLNRDPIGYEGGDENLYRYVGDAPLVNTDPTGYSTLGNVTTAGSVPRTLQVASNPAPGLAYQGGLGLTGGLTTGEVASPTPVASFTILSTQQDVCGLEIGAALDAFAQAATQKFNNLLITNPAAVRRACATLNSSAGWEIFGLYDALKYDFSTGGCGTGRCRGTVQVHGQCYWASEVNYFWYGLANRLCRVITLGDALQNVILWRLGTFGFLWGDGTTAGRVGWTLGGGWNNTTIVPATASECSLCPRKVNPILTGHLGSGSSSINVP